MSDAHKRVIHASCVAIDRRAVLILGAPGAGKSALALELISRGADLVSDDRTTLVRDEDRIIAYAPETIQGLIEAREVGVLALDDVGPAQVMFVVDLDRHEGERIPELYMTELLGVPLPVLHKSDMSHFPAAIMVYLKGRRKTPS